MQYLDADHVLADPDPGQLRNDLESKLVNDLAAALVERAGGEGEAEAVVSAALVHILSRLTPGEAFDLGTNPEVVRQVEAAVEAHRLADIASRS